ncbi:hypothetical protein Tco_0827892, partial [Tanacetum coccineum]
STSVDCGTQGPGNGNVGLQNRGPGNRDVRLENLNVDIDNRERVEVLSNTNVNVPELQTSLGVHQPTPAATFTTSESN